MDSIAAFEHKLWVFEENGLDEEEATQLMQRLIDTGKVWDPSMPEKYREIAAALLLSGHCHTAA